MAAFEKAKNWPNIYKKKAKVISLDTGEAGTLEEFKKLNLETWPKIYSDYSEEKIKKEYLKFVDYKNSFHGCCYLYEEVQFVSREQSQVIIISPNWSGKIEDHQDLEIWLRKEYHIWPPDQKLKCKIYSFGTAHIPAGSIHAKMGDPVGGHRVSHLIGDFDIEFDNFSTPKIISLFKNDSFGKESIKFKLIN